MKLRLLLWLLFLIVCIGLALRTPVVADLTAFLPASATRSQQLLVEQLKSGVAARLMLVAVEGNDPLALAEVSRKLVQGLRDTGLFSYANNGGAQSTAHERELLLRYRYLLSPAVTPEHFTVTVLREALQNDLELLASPAGVFVKPVLAQDPSGELSRLMKLFVGGPDTRYGVWFSHDEKRALLIAETKAAGFELEAQSRAAAVADRAFTAARPSADMRLLLTGPGVFAAESRAIIERDSWRLTLIAAVLVFAILF
ncbi:MAG: MMPL family transporter, partial [Burkholderiales bacterium]